MIERRSFLTGLIALVAAPAIVRAGSLMPVKQMIQPLATVDASHQIGSTLIINPLSETLKIGDIITIDGVNAVNRIFPDRAKGLRQFVVTVLAEKGNTHVHIYPPILPPMAPVEYGYGPTVAETPRNRAELKRWDWTDRAQLS